MESVLRRLLLFTAPLLGHDLYLMPERFLVQPGESVQVAIHNGDRFPASEQSPVLARVRDFGIFGGAPAADLRIDGSRAVGTLRTSAPGTVLITARTVPNFLSLSPAKFAAYLKEEGLDWVIAEREKRGESGKPSRELYAKHAKSLLVVGSPGDRWRVAAGLALEFLPESDPGGAAVRYVVLWKGQPAPGLRVELSRAWNGRSTTKILGFTDAQGGISVAVPGPGRYRLHTVGMRRSAQTQQADWESDWASLTWEVR